MTDPTDAPREADPPRDFASVLLEQGRGHSHAELSRGLHDLVARVKDTGKKGSLTYTLVVEPMKGNDAAVITKDEIRLRLPEHDRQASIFYMDRAGNLTRTDPNQAPLWGDLAEAPAPRTAVVDLSTGEIQE